MSQENNDKKYDLRPFKDCPETQLRDELSTVKLNALDLSLYKEGVEGYETRLALAKTLEDSITTYGFFNVVNFGYDWDKIERLRSIAQSVMEIPEEEKLKHLAGARYKEDELEYNNEDDSKLGGERGNGFKPKGYWHLKNGVRDSVTHYNFRNMLQHDLFFDPGFVKHPEVVTNYLKEISEFYNFIHNDILEKLSNLCDIILGIPEGTLFNKYFKVVQGQSRKSGGGHGRFMLYEPFASKEDEEKVSDTWLRGHSDISGFSFITSQPMLALQIKDYFTSEWRYVDHRPNSLIVNIGDAMEFISGSYFKAVVHRVSQPPLDQRLYDRLVIIYFCNPTYDSVLDPEELGSPKLEKLGLTRNASLKEWEKINFNDWDSVKGNLLGRSNVGERNLLKFYGRYIERWHHFEGLKHV